MEETSAPATDLKGFAKGGEWSVHVPNKFLQTHWRQLLPSWPVPVQSVIVWLQPSQIPLLRANQAVEQEKNRLREQLLLLGKDLAASLGQAGYPTEVFDPRSGLPTGSKPGSLHLDDLTLIQSLLGYPARHQGKCRVMVHPTWGAAVYPGIILSAATPEFAANATILAGQR